MLAACDYAQRQRSELNRINVFPVPDGDTGTNLALTVQAIADHLRNTRAREISVVAGEAAQAAVLGARGNCGMMLSHFLLGMAEQLEGRDRVRTQEFGYALVAGVENLHAAIERPVEGTILTVMRDTAQAAAVSVMEDFQLLIADMLNVARDSLARTPKLLPALQKAGVVDAGAKGFVHLLEGVNLYIRGDSRALASEASPASTSGPAVAQVSFEEEEQYRYCTEALVKGENLPEAGEVRAVLREKGDSLIVIRSKDLLKIHVHTDDPEDVFSYLRSLGRMATHKAEDMKAQHAAVERSAGAHVSLARRPITVLTDSAADLPDEVVRAHGIQVVPLWLMEGDTMYRDRVDISAEEFQRRLGGESGPLPTTSQPAPADFLSGFARAAEDGEKVLGVILSSTLSGTFASAEAAAFRFKDAEVYLSDSLSASLLQGLLVLKAAEMAEMAQEPKEILEELARIRAQSGVYFTVDNFDRLLASGRVGKGKAWLASMVGLKPIFGLTPTGRLKAFGGAVGRGRVLKKMLDTVEAQIPPGAEKIRFGVMYVGNPEMVEVVSHGLRQRFGKDVEILSNPATPVISTHVGVGAWGIAYIVED
jgi:DegV family protein with EDD domain